MPRWEQGGKAAIIPCKLGVVNHCVGLQKVSWFAFLNRSLSLLLAKCRFAGREPQVILRGSANEVKTRTNPSTQQELAGHSQVPKDRHSGLTLLLGGPRNGVTFRFRKF